MKTLQTNNVALPSHTLVALCVSLIFASSVFFGLGSTASADNDTDQYDHHATSTTSGTSTPTMTSGTSTPTTGTTTPLGSGTSTEDMLFYERHYALRDGGLTYETDLSLPNEIDYSTTSTSTVKGTAGVWFEPGGKDMNYWAFIEGKESSDKITAAHLHCGARGQSGPIVALLYSNASGTPANGELTFRGDIENANIATTTAMSCLGVIGYGITTTNDLARAIGEGKIYVNVHSIAYPQGVSRGQLREVTHYVSSDEFDRRQNL